MRAPILRSLVPTLGLLLVAAAPKAEAQPRGQYYDTVVCRDGAHVSGRPGGCDRHRGFDAAATARFQRYERERARQNDRRDDRRDRRDDRRDRRDDHRYDRDDHRSDRRYPW